MNKNFLLITSCIVVSIWTNLSVLQAENHQQTITLKSHKPAFSAIELFSGTEVNFPCQKDKICIISFFSEKTSSAVFEWLSVLPMEDIDPQKTEFINIIFPGGIFFMIPPGKALKAIRNQVRNEIDKNLADSSPEQRDIFNSLNIKWVADLQRKLFRSWELSSNESWFFFFPENQQTPVVYKGFSRLQSIDFMIRLHLNREF